MPGSFLSLSFLTLPPQPYLTPTMVWLSVTMDVNTLGKQMIWFKQKGPRSLLIKLHKLSLRVPGTRKHGGHSAINTVPPPGRGSHLVGETDSEQVITTQGQTLWGRRSGVCGVSTGLPGDLERTPKRPTGVSLIKKGARAC